MRKQIVESNAVDLPENVAARLNGHTVNMNPLLISLHVYTLKNYLQTKYGNRQSWIQPLQRMLDHKERMDGLELVAVERVIKEVNGTER